MPLLTFFSVLELPEKKKPRKGGLQQPPLVRRGLIRYYEIKFLLFGCLVAVQKDF